MKINDINKYHQKIDLKTKVKLVNDFLKHLDKNLTNDFDLLRLDYPLVFNDESIFVSRATNQRIICFDSYNADNLFLLGGDLSI